MHIMKLAALCGLSGALLSTACADSSTRALNPVSPSAVVVDTASSTSDAVSRAMGNGKGNGNSGNNGNGNGNNGNGNTAGGNGNGNADNGNGNGNGSGNSGNGNAGGGNNTGTAPVQNQPPTVPPVQPPSTPPSPPVHVRTKVEIEGLISAIGSGSLTVSGQAIVTTSATVIRQEEVPVLFSVLQPGDRVHVRAMRVTDGASTRLEAAEIKLQNPVGHDDDDDDAPEGPGDPTSVLVAVVALDATAVEGTTDKAIFLLSRSGETTEELTVTIELTGTAASGTDYDALPLTVTFAAGAATANVQVTAKSDETVEVSETVTLTVVDGTGYLAGAPAAATVGIADAE